MMHKINSTLAILLIVAGGVLFVTYMIPGSTYESLWPLLLIAAGIVWLVPTRRRAKDNA